MVKGQRRFILWAGIFGLLGVLFGAFGAHSLEAVLDTTQLDNFKTGVRYQFFHALGLLFLGLYSRQAGFNKLIYWCGNSFIIGILLFSGSIYLLSTSAVLGIPGINKGIFWMTPLGGVLFAFGWALLVIHALKSKTSS